MVGEAEVALEAADGRHFIPAEQLPLSGIRVIDFGHMVMGPSCGVTLADLGAEVIRVEPIKGDPTRTLSGFAAGFYDFFNRNKRSVALDLKSEKGLQTARELIKSADILIENFGPGTMDRLGLSWSDASALNERLIYCQLKGYLKGPYENYMALDEVVQMHAGLAYMTGPKGTPLRAGASIVDIGGGMFGVIGILAALHQRGRTGKGSLVQSALFETAAFFVGQHMATAAIQGEPTEPMPGWRDKPGKQATQGAAAAGFWSIYQTFRTADGAVFLGTTTEAQWQRFCTAFGFGDVASDPRFADPKDRRNNLQALGNTIQGLIERMSTQDVVAKGRAAQIPAAPVGKPDDLFEDPHLNKYGGLAETRVRGDKRAKLPLLPIAFSDARFGLRLQPPGCGEHTQAILQGLGYTDDQIEELRRAGAVR